MGGERERKREWVVGEGGGATEERKKTLGTEMRRISQAPFCFRPRAFVANRAYCYRL